ncbi:phage portal protein, partial [Streptococcus gordonii]|nr:phage portal protein [Streptococcus gordonii]
TEIKAYIEAGGAVSQETLMNNASFTDYKTEQSRIMKEQGARDGEISQIVGAKDDEQPEEE